jgi:hypothetical protein
VRACRNYKNAKKKSFSLLSSRNVLKMNDQQSFISNNDCQIQFKKVIEVGKTKKEQKILDQDNDKISIITFT